ncbi:unnamed protein product [Brassica napus]|uniref:(rape) hypothetical protein n=1 Tax=Brassica napus TaxID=3708 RepID=A0A816NYV3_BRANA|nr:unnamed protein product [Brassica napus]
MEREDRIFELWWPRVFLSNHATTSFRDKMSPDAPTIDDHSRKRRALMAMNKLDFIYIQSTAMSQLHRFG